MAVGGPGRNHPDTWWHDPNGRSTFPPPKKRGQLGSRYILYLHIGAGFKYVFFFTLTWRNDPI